jgi:hypothetical protein
MTMEGGSKTMILVVNRKNERSERCDKGGQRLAYG